jgi:myo-inositol-1-phosphate synthase
VGLWLIGARGSIATCVTYGLAGLRAGMIEPVGLITSAEPLAGLDLASWEEFVIGGHDVCRRDLTHSAGELVKNGILKQELVSASSAEAAQFEANIRPGVLDGPDVGFADLDPRAAELGSASPREQIAALTRDFDEFKTAHKLDRVVVVNLSSTEVFRQQDPAWESLAKLEQVLDDHESQPASIVYAYAALRAKCPFVNFTPNLGASIPALIELAEEVGMPHCGNDGKTGETLVKTALAPMFRARALKVLSWQGYNMLGNRDGAALSDPGHCESKLANKDKALRSILDDDQMHTHVGIDYVPSLDDWKTAWDFIHFEGFLGVKMSLQFTWAGSDSALAAPLILDLVRLADFAAERGERGVMSQTAPFFKSPLAGGSNDFHAQFAVLMEYAQSRRSSD